MNKLVFVEGQLLQYFAFPLFMAAFLTFFVSLSYADITSNLVGWWKLDDNRGSTVFDSSSNNNGSLVNSPTWTRGRIAGALSFNGTNYVQAADSSLPLGGSVRSAAAWVYVNAYTAPFSHIVHYGSGSANQSWGLVLDTGGGLLAHEWSVYQTAGVVPLGKWTHVAIVLAPGGVKTHYINGVSVGQTNDVPNTVSSGLLRIGCRVFNPTEYFNGVIDDVRIYSRTLTAGDVKEIYFQGCARLGNAHIRNGKVTY